MGLSWASGIEIDIEQTDTNLRNGYYGSVKITVSKETDGKKVPSDYERFDHKPTTSGATFNLGSIIHNDVQLNGIHFTENVTAVYVYYSKNDREHQFPLIVCVKKGQNLQTYYQRGNTWTNANINVDPDGATADTRLQGSLGEVKEKYEVRLENDTRSGGQYTARPGNGNADKIDVQGASTHNNYKGYRHYFAGNTESKKINFITIHNQVISNITELNGGFTHQASGGIFVYFETADDTKNREKPLLICLSSNGKRASNNVWYKRQPGNIWKKAVVGKDNTYNTIRPGNIDVTFAGKLDSIKDSLRNNDIGYPKPSINVKLDYIPKNESNTSISYVTNNKQITVTNVTTNIPTGYIAYEYKSTNGNLTDVKFKHFGVELKGLPKTGININSSNNKVWVYYEKDYQGQPIIDKPLLLYVREGTDKWYRRGIPWKTTNNVKGDPNSSTTPTGLEAELDKMARLGTFRD